MTAAFPPPPWRMQHPFDPRVLDREVVVVRAIDVDAPLGLTVEIVNDIASIHLTERKADTVDLVAETATTGTYRVRGRVAGIVPWRATFRYQLAPNGFHSVDTAPVGAGWNISGGFVVEPIDDLTCRIVHYEQYLVGRRARWVRPFLRAYIRHSMIGELRDLAERARRRATTAASAAVSP